MWSAMYKQYGKWSITGPFEKLSKLETHIEMYLDRPEKDYITEIRILPLDEEFINGLRKWEKKNK